MIRKNANESFGQKSISKDIYIHTHTKGLTYLRESS